MPLAIRCLCSFDDGAHRPGRSFGQRLRPVFIQDLLHALSGPLLQCLGPLSLPVVMVLAVDEVRILALPEVGQRVFAVQVLPVGADLVDQVHRQGRVAYVYALQAVLDPAQDLVADNQLSQGVTQA